MAIIELLQRSARPFVCLGLLSASTLSFGEVAVPQITQRVNNQQRVTLPGNVRPLPKGARDLGAVAANLPASRVLLLLKRPAAQETALQKYIANAHTPGNASYHHWLTPAQFGSQFGPADADVQAVTAWLQTQGFAVGKVSPAKTTIEFSGTAGQIEKSFATQIHSFRTGTETHISNITNPQIPAALAPVVAGISPLNDFRVKPLHTTPLAREVTPAPTNANAKAVVLAPRGGSRSTAKPEFTGSNGLYYVTPADAATIYNTPNQALNRNYAASKNLTGSGVTIGIAGTSNVDLANIVNYRSLFGLPALTPTVITDGNDPGVQGDASVEALLDLEVASALAPAANLNLYVADSTSFQEGLFLAIQRALDDNVVNILNVSFGACEAYQGQAGNLEVLNFWQQAAAQGISITVSSGDSGAAGCDNSNVELSATQGLQVNGLASTPYNIAVGGTDFNQTSATIPQYWSSTNSSIAGSALGPIPEIPWNNSTTTIGSFAGNVPYMDNNGDTRIDGAGGGVSGCTTSNVDANGNVLACSASYAKPTWQSGFGGLNAREIPDVSLFAANAGHAALWALCASGLGGDQPGDVDCVKDGSGSFGLQGVGGTSASSPAFAGMLALVIQNLQTGSTSVRLGQADYTLYPLSKQHANAFHDVTTGNISVVCVAGSPDCGSNGFLAGYDAVAGYDAATGLGSVDATQMVQNWSSIAFKPTTTSLQLNGSASTLTITHGASVNVTAAVTSSSGGTPTGDIALVNSGGGTPPPAAAVQGTVGSPGVFTLGSNGTVNGTDAYLPGGTYTVNANYNGDGQFGASVSNGVNVVVNQEPSILDLFVLQFSLANNGQGASANGLSLPYGSYVSVYAQPFSTAQAGLANPPATYSLATGAVTFTSTASLLNAIVPINSSGYAEIPGQTVLAYPPGVYTVSAAYPGDPSFGASSAVAQTFTITKGDTAIAAGDGSASGTVIVEVDQSNSTYFVNAGAALPTGTVTVANSSGATIGTGVLAPVNVQGGQAAQATVTLTTAVPSGTAVTLSYPGDSNFNASTASFTPGGGSAPFTLSAAPSTVTISSGGSASTTVSITPKSGFTGSVNVTCSVSGGNNSLLPTCALDQPTVTLSGTAAVTDKLTIATVSSNSALHLPAGPLERTWYTAGGVAFAGLLLLGLPGRRRAWQRMLSLMLLVVAMGVAGCGGGGGGSNTTPAGTYQVLVTATSGTSSQTSTVQVTVQ